MQPYFYPYLGYFELIKSVDKFVFLNDVQYIRKGWVNRNKISENFYLTVPVTKCSQKTLINQVKINYQHDWHHKHCRSLESKYGKQCQSNPVYLFYKNCLQYTFLVDLLKDSIKNVCNFLKLKTEFIDSECFCIDASIKNQNRILEICTRLKAKEYYNLPGGRLLYRTEYFENQNINLCFLDTNKIQNKLSIFDFCLKQ